MSSHNIGSNASLWNKGFIFLIITNLFVYQGFQMLIPILPVYIMDIGGSDLEASLVTSLFAISGLVFRSLTGIALDKYGRRLLLFIGFFILFLLNVSLFWVSAVSFILVLRLFHGIGWGITSTTIATVMSDTVPAHRRGEGTGYYALSVILATSAAPMIAIALMSYILVFGYVIGVGQVWIYYVGHCVMIVISRPVMGKLFDSKGHAWAILPGIISMFIGLLLLAVTHNMVTLIIASIFFGFGFGASQPSLQAWALNSKRSSEWDLSFSNGFRGSIRNFSTWYCWFRTWLPYDVPN